jgi:hypothetical protein
VTCATPTGSAGLGALEDTMTTEQKIIRAKVGLRWHASLADVSPFGAPPTLERIGGVRCCSDTRSFC